MEQPIELTLKSIFSESEYIIPIYQRSYAWENKEIDQFLNDILDFQGKMSIKYYLGSLVVDDLGEKRFSVIDGQQRLTTIFLLFTYLKNQTKENTQITISFSENSLRFEAREKSNRTLGKLFHGEINETFDNSYSKELLNGYKIIETYFQQQKIDIQKFIETLERIIIIRVPVPKNIDLNHYFEIMNTRGEQLELHEIAKGKILAQIHDDTQQKIAAMIWDNCSQMDKYIQMTFDTKIRTQIFGENWDTFSDDLENWDNVERLCNNPKKELPNSDTLDDVLEKLQNGEKIKNVKYEPVDEEENQRFESIVSFPTFLLIVNECLRNKEQDSSLDDKNFLDNLKENWANEDSAKQFIFALLKYRFVFDTYIIKREYAKDHKEIGKWTLKKFESKEYDKKIKPYYDTNTFENIADQENVLALQSALRITYTSPKTMHWIAIALKNVSNLLEALEEYSCEKIRESDYRNDSGFHFERIVFTYLDYILYRDREKKEIGLSNQLSSYQFSFRNSIEHFYPQTPIGGSHWESGPLNSFGNLALLTVSANSKFSNLSPESKIKEHPEIVNQSPKLILMVKLMGSDGWNEKKAKEHGEAMFKLLDDELKKYSNNSDKQ